MSLRDYQLAAVQAARELLRVHRSALIQLPTGAGKTPIIAEITRSAFARDRLVWIIAPRTELVGQASAHLQHWGVAHGLITAQSQESRAFDVHVISLQTLQRRIKSGRIKRWPDLIFFDEAHINYDAQINIIAAVPEETKILGCTATPERLSGEGLNVIYGGIHYGPSIPWLTERGYLSPLRYFAPPIEGLEDVHRKGTEFDADELDELYKKRKVYGSVVEYYRDHGRRKNGSPMSALIFCRSVKSAYDVAERFRGAGYRFECIEGAMPDKRRRDLVQALKEGTIDGLTNCELATYGLDVPRVEYGASIRPTLSRALYFQMVGRILRPFPGKDEALFFDHANLVQEHTSIEYPGTPLFYLDSIDWNFSGRERRPRAERAPELKLCPANDYQYCDKATCAGCSLKPEGTDDPRRQALPEVEATLEERKAPPRWSDLQPEERREVQDRIGTASDAAVEALALGQIAAGPIGELLAVAESLGWKPMTVYWRLEERLEKKVGHTLRAVNIPLLREIARQKNYAPGWCWYKKKEIEKGIKEKEPVAGYV